MEILIHDILIFKELKVKGENYFGADSFVGNTWHKIYSNFNQSKTTLLDGFLSNHELFKKFHHLWMILTRLHFFSAKSKVTIEEKN